MAKTFRIEHDFPGDREILEDNYCGVQAFRALENFPFAGTPISSVPELIKSLTRVKKAAVLVNLERGVYQDEISGAIVAACDEIIADKLYDQFSVDIIQGGSGVSTSMNANLVIARRSIEILGLKKGEYQFVN